VKTRGSRIGDLSLARDNRRCYLPELSTARIPGAPRSGQRRTLRVQTYLAGSTSAPSRGVSAGGNGFRRLHLRKRRLSPVTALQRQQRAATIAVLGVNAGDGCARARHNANTTCAHKLLPQRLGRESLRAFFFPTRNSSGPLSARWRGCWRKQSLPAPRGLSCGPDQRAEMNVAIEKNRITNRAAAHRRPVCL
jgi:hypothetical protein